MSTTTKPATAVSAERAEVLAQRVQRVLTTHFSTPCHDPRCDPFGGLRRSQPMVEHASELVCRAVRAADRDKVATVLAAHFPHGYACGTRCDYLLNSSSGWAQHVTPRLLSRAL